MLIGRDQELARIEQTLDAARAGRSSALLIRGEPGIGKTSLLLLADDLQWLDAPTVEAIVFTARRLRGEGIAMLLAARTGTGHEIDASGLEELRPRPLDADAAVEL